MDQSFVEKLTKAETAEEFLAVIDHADQEKPDIDSQLAAQNGKQENSPSVSEEAEASKAKASCRILAVTSCPTGIAHTYMAAEGLEKAARAAGCSLKVETRGSGGAKNVLTEQEIAEAIAEEENKEM